MATLTSTGVTTSNGTLDGYYTGSSSTNTSFPLGAFVLSGVNLFDGDILSNSSRNLWCANSNNYLYLVSNSNPGGRTAVGGTWRARGSFPVDSGASVNVLMQRTA